MARWGRTSSAQDLTAEDFGGPSLEGCNDNLVLTRPDVIQGIHESFLAVGCDVVETCTFQSTPRRLTEWGLGDKVDEINVRRGAARPRCVRPVRDAGVAAIRRRLDGSHGDAPLQRRRDALGHLVRRPGGELLRSRPKGSSTEVSMFCSSRRRRTFSRSRRRSPAFERLFAELGRRVALQAQVTLDTSGRMLLGTDIASAMTTLESLGVDVIGLNCSTGPEHMREPIRYLGEHATLPVSVIPNAGLPLNTGIGEAVYPLEPAPMAAALAEFVRDFGVRIVGGCCGTTPQHLRQSWRRVKAVEAKHEVARAARDARPRVSSAMRAITLHQDPPPLLIGERVNAQGSRKVKRLLLADDYDGIVQVAREQVDAGAHVLDVCVAVTERADEAEQMSEVVQACSR